MMHLSWGFLLARWQASRIEQLLMTVVPSPARHFCLAARLFTSLFQSAQCACLQLECLRIRLTGLRLQVLYSVSEVGQI
jgi:hypothetical protein